MKRKFVSTFAVALLTGSVLANAANPPTEQEEAKAICEKTLAISKHKDDEALKGMSNMICGTNVESKRHWECVALLVVEGNSVGYSMKHERCKPK